LSIYFLIEWLKSRFLVKVLCYNHPRLFSAESDKRGLKQREISQIIGIPQPEVSHLMNGEFQRFSEEKLLTFLKRLDTEIT